MRVLDETVSGLAATTALRDPITGAAGGIWERFCGNRLNVAHQRKSFVLI